MENKKGLEHLVIPGSWENSRIERAVEELKSRNFDRIIITGGYEDKETLPQSTRYKIYRAIRNAKTLNGDAIKPIQMNIINGVDSEEDILYLGKTVSSGDIVCFDTFYLHYLEYKMLINKAIRDKKFPNRVKTQVVTIHQGGKEIIYGFLGLLEEIIKRRSLDYKINRKGEDKLDRIKKFVKRLIG
mgnify:CR=1 FL=1